MEIVVEKVKSRIPVTVLRVRGDLDGTSYRALIDAAKIEHDAGARNFLVDLKQVPYMSSAGLVALHSIVKMVRGDEMPEGDWKDLSARQKANEMDPHVKLFDPSPRVSQLLKMAGVTEVLDVLINYDVAIASF